jgi:superfamily II DNA helicase RecQ
VILDDEPAPKSADSRAAALLKEWRRAQAKKLGVPSFRVMSDRVLMAIAEDQPSNLAELMAIPGIGLKTVEKYGAQIYRVLDQARR